MSLAPGMSEAACMLMPELPLSRGLLQLAVTQVPSLYPGRTLVIRAHGFHSCCAGASSWKKQEKRYVRGLGTDQHGIVSLIAWKIRSFSKVTK